MGRTKLVRRIVGLGLGSLIGYSATWIASQVAEGVRKRLQWEADRAKFANERTALGGLSPDFYRQDAERAMAERGIVDIPERVARMEEEFRRSGSTTEAARLAEDVIRAGGGTRSNIVILVRRKGSDRGDWRELRANPDGPEFQA